MRRISEDSIGGLSFRAALHVRSLWEPTALPVEDASGESVDGSTDAREGVSVLLEVSFRLPRTFQEAPSTPDDIDGVVCDLHTKLVDSTADSSSASSSKKYSQIVVPIMKK